MNRLLLLPSLVFLSMGQSMAQDYMLQHLRTFRGHEHGVKKAVFAPDAKTFASGGTRGELMFWDVESGQVIKKLEGHYSSINDLRYTRDGRFIITAANDGHVKVWDANSGALIGKFNTSERVEDRKNIYFAILSDDAQLAYFGGEDRKLRVGLVGSDEPCRVLYTDKKDAIRCAALSPDGREIVFASGQYLIVLDLSTNKVVREYNTGTCQINALQFSADGKLLLSWCANARVDMRDAKTFALKTSFRTGSGERKFSNMAFSDDQKYVISGDEASRFHMWDLAAKKLVLNEGANQGTIQDFDVNTKQNYLLSASLDKTIKLWKLAEKVIEEDPKPKKKTELLVEPAPDIVILSQTETADDFMPAEPRQAEVAVQEVVKPALPEPIVEVVPEVKVEPAPEIAVAAKIEVEVKPVYQPELISQVKKTAVDSMSVVPETINGRRIKPIRSDHRLNLLSRKLTFQIWDAQVIDGDIISIFINDECIVKEYSIVNDRHTVSFDASMYKKAYLYLHAHNVGTIPPNTATMMVSDGVQEIQVELRSDLTGSAAMELNFVEP